MIFAAAYCRVSTDKRDQANSFENQQMYFKDYIDRHPQWQLYRIYADEGITGTSAARPAFQQMMRDARAGCFQWIVTKEISRFSRNVMDAIGYTRELRALGVGVLFLGNGINTMSDDSELQLSIFGSIAQEESRSISARVKWGQTRQMEKGVVFGHSLLGYQVRNGQITIEPVGAGIVRRIFYQYGVEQKSTAAIARELQADGCCTVSGSPKWTCGHLLKILRNEKYKGDLVQKKTYTPNFLTHQKQYNRGAEPLVVIEGHHEAIIDPELWEAVQREMARRSRKGTQPKGRGSVYPYSGKIRCEVCGASFVARTRYRKKGNYLCWSCGTAVREGCRRIENGVETGCDVRIQLRNDTVTEMIRQALSAVPMDRVRVAKRLSRFAEEAMRQTEEAENTSKALRAQMAQLRRKKLRLMDLCAAEQWNASDVQVLCRQYDQTLQAMERQVQSLQGNISHEAAVPEQEIGALITGERQEPALYRSILEQLNIYPDGTAELRLKGIDESFFFQEKCEEP